MRFEQIPSPLPGMRLWGASMGRYNFVISHEDGKNLRPEDRAEWTGYTASYKPYEGRDHKAVRLDGRWQRFVDAEQACWAAWKQLRQQH